MDLDTLPTEIHPSNWSNWLRLETRTPGQLSCGIIAPAMNDVKASTGNPTPARLRRAVLSFIWARLGATSTS